VRLAGSRLRWLSSALITLLMSPAAAEAHMTIKGVNHFTNGALHPLVTPAHVLILLGLGLWIGQHPPLRLKLPMAIFAAFSLAGLALTLTGWVAEVHPAFLAVIALCFATAVAVGKPLPSWVRGVFLAAGAVAIGLDSVAEPGPAKTVVSALLGTWLAILLIVVNIAHYTSLAAEKNKQWLHIAIRVAASWIVAISLLVLAFALRKH
jgi:hydrogenase/urease accessory protein HupE